MSKYTCELRTLVKQFNIFDFNYQRSPESIAIVSNEELQEGFINHFYFSEIGFETLERFKHQLKVLWCENLGEFDKLLVAYNQKIDTLTNNSANADVITADKDAPKNNINFNGLLDKPSYVSNSKTKATGKTLTDIELLEKYHDKIKDIQTEFYESLTSLFMQIF